jgi:SAM-dependent methyltransferase
MGNSAATIETTKANINPAELEIDEAKLEQFLGQVVTDIGAAWSSILTLLGDDLGLYKAMAGAGGLTPEQLAERTDTHPRYVREWLNAQAAGGYVTYDAANETYTLPNEHAAVLADDDSPGFMIGGFQIALAAVGSRAKLADAFRSGDGVGWHEHDDELFCGCGRFFRTGYKHHLVQDWIPALSVAEDKLKAGAKVADVGCGVGYSTIIMAQAYPNSTFVGFDYHEESLRQARENAEAAGVGDRVSFEVGMAKDFGGTDYDLVACFDCLHDMGDPVGASAHVHQALAEDGTWLLVEPFAEDETEKNHNPVGRIYYSASTCLCTPSSRSQEVGLGLGAQAGESRLRDVVGEGGFTRFRRATQTPFNFIFEARR